MFYRDEYNGMGYDYFSGEYVYGDKYYVYGDKYYVYGNKYYVPDEYMDERWG